MNMLLVLLQEAPAKGNPLTSFLPLILILVVFWLFMIRPQMKKQKEVKKYRESIQKGDKVVTIGGIYGKINEVKDRTVILDVGNNIILKVDRDAINRDMSDLMEAPK